MTRHDRHCPRPALPLLVVAVCVLLAGCGTNVRRLIEYNADLVRTADGLLAEAGELEAAPVYAAEAARVEACAEIDRATLIRFESDDPEFGEQLLSDLAVVAALIVPVAVVENCAAAQTAYEATVLDLVRHPRNGSAELAAGIVPIGVNSQRRP